MESRKQEEAEKHSLFSLESNTEKRDYHTITEGDLDS